MWPLELFVLALATVTTQVSSLPHYPYTDFLQPREYVTSLSASDSYDFIIAGGGLAGLVLASRLSEDANTTVLVLEAGDSGDAVADTLNIPSNTYFSSLLHSSYDWAYNTVTQSNAASRSISWPRGKVLGGSSAINGMYLVRPSELDINTWQSLIAPSSSSADAERWGWDSFFSALKKSENFTAPVPDVQTTANIEYNPSLHGTSGPLHASYPGYMVEVVSNWIPTLAGVGIPEASDSGDGSTLGGFIAQSSINPSNWTRSYSKTAYIDPLPPRSNLHIMVNSTVMGIIFANSSSSSSGLKATGVQYSTSQGSTSNTVNVNKEVILAGGSVGSPQMLMLSGIGPKDVLNNAGVDVLMELPGVGQHLQDHLVLGVYYNTTADTQGSIHASGNAESQTPEFKSFINSATGYVNASFLFGGDAGVSTFQQSVVSALQTSVSTLVPSTDASVIQGYQAIYNATVNTLVPGGAGLVELLMAVNAVGQIAVQAALQHPFSQGRLYITSASAWDAPVIDPQYFSHPADVEVLREGLKLARRILQAAPLNSVLENEITPGSTVNTDAEWETWMRNTAGTEFHPTGTCAMLPQEQGGVVNAKLQVYGTSNVRVVDASVYPIEFTSHLGAPTYALAEQGADIIRSFYNIPASTSTSSSSGSQPTSSSGSTTKKSGSVSSLSHLSFKTFIGLSAVSFAAFFC